MDAIEESYTHQVIAGRLGCLDQVLALSSRGVAGSIPGL